MSRLHDLFTEQGQSPWLDNLRRDWLQSGELGRWVERGVRGVTSNPSIFQKAFTATDAYDEQFAALVGAGRSVTDAYWDLVVDDIVRALALREPFEHFHAVANAGAGLDPLLVGGAVLDGHHLLDAGEDDHRRLRHQQPVGLAHHDVGEIVHIRQLCYAQ